MGKHLTPTEKEVLIKRYRANPGVSMDQFCMANKISATSMRKWMVAYDALGIEGLTDKRLQDPNVQKYLPGTDDPPEKDLKRALMLSRIECERLKKNMKKIQTPDGGYAYVHLRKKNSGS